MRGEKINMKKIYLVWLVVLLGIVTIASVTYFTVVAKDPLNLTSIESYIDVKQDSDSDLDMLPEPGVPPEPVPNLIVGDEKSEVVIGVDERGWSVLRDEQFGLELHFPPQWIFEKNLGEQKYTFMPKKVLEREDLNLYEYDSFSVLFSSANEVAERIYYARDPWQHFNFRMQEFGATNTEFKGNDAYWLADAQEYAVETPSQADESIRRAVLTFRNDSDFYNISVTHVPETSTLLTWEDALYFIESISVIK